MSVVLQAVFDDSGDHDGPVFVLGGLMASVDAWAAFEADWRAELARGPGLRYFKAAEANGLRGQFAPRYGWNRRTRDDKVQALCAIIRQHVAARIHVSVDVPAFHRFMKSVPAAAGHNSTKPYFSAFYNIATLILEMQVFGDPAGIPNQVDLIFDQQGGIGSEAQLSLHSAYAAWVSKEFSGAPRQPRDVIKSLPAFRDDLEFLPLQAADLYAWSIRRAIADYFDDPDSIPNALYLALFDIPPAHRHLDEKWFAQVVPTSGNA